MIPTTYKAVFEVRNDVYTTQANDPNATEWQVEINLGSLMKGDKGDTGDAATIAVGSVSASTGSTAGATVTNSGDEHAAVFDFSFTLPKGDTGATGNGIQSVSKTGTSGLVDTYTVLFTDGNSTTFTVTNGEDGVGIQSINKTSTSGLVDTYTVTLTDSNTTTFTVTNGANGADGVGIRSIAKTSTSGLVDTYTITYTDGTTSTYTVTNGQDGTGAGDMTRLVYDSSNTVANAGGIVAYVASIPSSAAEETTWTQLKAKRDGGTLTPGRQYRITDYVATTIQEDSRSANHPFDIIVTALTASTLSEEAGAALHLGDTYFSTVDINAWKIWYCLDNDTSRFTWADTTTGKGVVYRLIDEYHNDIPYDFKGIQFKRYEVDTVTDTAFNPLIGLPIGLSDNTGITVDSSSYKWYYAFSDTGSSWAGDVTDASLVGLATSVKFTSSDKSNPYDYPPALMNTVFAYGEVVFTFLHELDGDTTSVYDPLTFATSYTIDGCHCINNTFIGYTGMTTSIGTFRNNLIVGTFRHARTKTNFQNNTILTTSDFAGVDFGHNCDENLIFANTIKDTTFGNQVSSNKIIATSIQNSTIGNAVFNNTFTDIYFGSVVMNGQLTHCSFSGRFIGCTFNPISSYVDYVGGTGSSSCVGVDFVGSIRGTSGSHITVSNANFILASAQGINRRIRVEGDPSGKIVATWMSAGKTVGQMKAPSDVSWTDIPSVNDLAFFDAEFDVTSFDDIAAAYNAGKQVRVWYNWGLEYPYSYAFDLSCFHQTSPYSDAWASFTGLDYNHRSVNIRCEKIGGLDTSIWSINVRPIPEISTNIISDASSDTKTASPKAVKTYADGLISTSVTTDASSDTKASSPKSVKTYVDNALPSVMTGAGASADGASGLVPKPNAGDNVKFLKGDGTWASPTGTSSSAVVAGVTLTDPIQGTGTFTLNTQSKINWISQTYVVGQTVGSPITEATFAIDSPTGTWASDEITFLVINDGQAVVHLRVNSHYGDSQTMSYPVYINGDAIDPGVGLQIISIPIDKARTFRLVRAGGCICIDYINPSI